MHLVVITMVTFFLPPLLSLKEGLISSLTREDLGACKLGTEPVCVKLSISYFFLRRLNILDCAD